MNFAFGSEPENEFSVPRNRSFQLRAGFTIGTANLFAGFLVIALICLIFNGAIALTLDESIAIALKGNPSLLAEQEQMKAAGAKAGQAFSALWPSLSATAAYGQSYTQPMTVSINIPGTPPMSFATSPDNAMDVTTYSFNLQQPVFNWMLIPGTQMANASYLAAKASYEKAKSELIFNVTSAYFNVLRADKMVKVTNEGMETLNKHIKQMEVFYNSGMVTKSDLLQAQAQAANMQVVLTQARNGLQLTMIAFNSLISKPLAEMSFFSEAALSDNKQLNYDELLKTTFSQRPEWIAFQYSKQMAESAVGLAYGGYLPMVNLAGSSGRTITNYNSSGGPKYDLGSWRMMAVANWNIFDSFATQQRVTEADANARAVRNQEQAFRDGIILDLSSALLTLQGNQEKVAAARVAEDISRKALKYAEINFQANIGTSTDVLDAENSLHRAESDLWNAKYDLEVAKARLNKAVGTKIY